MTWHGTLHFSCTDCGNCCRGQGIVFVSRQEATAILEYLDLPAGEASRVFSQAEGRVALPLTKDGCVFWCDEQCSIYPVRPLQCRTFPFWKINLKSHGAWKRCAKTCDGIGQGRSYSFEEITALQRGEATTGEQLQLDQLPQMPAAPASINDLAQEAFGASWAETE